MLRDRSWVKSRIAARILLRRHRGHLLPRDRRMATQLAQDQGVTDRLIDQALACICAEKQIPRHEYQSILRAILTANRGGID